MTSSDVDINFGLSKEFIATVTLTLTNYGDADGTVTIKFIGDSSGSLGQKNIFVPAQNSVTDLIELDIIMNDNSVTYRI